MPTDAIPAPWIKPALTVACFAALWTWESLLPFFPGRRGRWRHAGRNVAIALINTVVLALLFGTATVAVAGWAARRELGLLHLLDLAWWRLPIALLLLDAWLYVWHRLNHRVPLLWRFHRMHHADHAMDVTTATRFHLGEHVGAATLRLGLIPLFGVTALEILVYETLVVAITMFHHANISIGPIDAPLRWITVTPFMHKVHHSRLRDETDSNYSTLFSFWDRLAGTYRRRDDPGEIDFGLSGFDEDPWQTVGGMLRTPFVSPASEGEASRKAAKARRD